MISPFLRAGAIFAVLFLVAGCDGAGGDGTDGGAGGGGGGGNGGGGGANLPAPSPGLTGTRETWREVSFITPPGMTKTARTDGLQFQDANNCAFYVLPERPPEADLAAQASSVLFALVGSGFIGLHDEFGGTNGFANWRGLTPEGFPYLIVRGYLVNTAGKDTAWARSMLVNLGSTVVPIVGLGEKVCFEDTISGTRLDFDWFYHSLQFPNATPPASPSLPSQLIGKWRIWGSNYFIGKTFAANGHYANATGSQTYSQVSSTEVLQTTTTFFGDGTYEAHQDRLTRTPASGPKAGVTETHLFNIIEEENSANPTGWLPSLHEISTTIDGATYSSMLRRDST